MRRDREMEGDTLKPKKTQRRQPLSGKKATPEGDGRSFEEIAEERKGAA
jgi:hypothetical protein